MTAQVLFFNDFSEKDPHLYAVEIATFQSMYLVNCLSLTGHLCMGSIYHLSQQLIYKSKIEKQNVSLNIFVSATSMYS